MKSAELTLINPVCMIVINDQNQVLLAKRATTGWGALGKWSIPGGGVEDGETFEETVVREIEEELSCEITWMKYFKSYSMQLDNVLARSIYFYGEISGGIKLQLDELSEYKWFDLNDPKLLELDYAFDQKEVMTDFIKFWKNRKNHEMP